MAEAVTSIALVSLVVLSFRRFQTTTGPCLATLADGLGDTRVQLILVDNGSDDGAAAGCAAFSSANPSVIYVPASNNLGFAGGMNAGVDAASGEWVCLVNSDTLFPKGALSALLVTLANAPADVGSVGPVTNSAGNDQCLRLPGVAMEQVVDVGAAAMRSVTGLLTPTYRSDFFCIAIRRAVWQKLGGLAPAFGLGYYEDFDFSLRLSKSGYRQVIAEDVFVAHVGSASFSAMGAAQKTLMRKNRSLLVERNPDARFEPARAGNAKALRYLLAVTAASGWTEALRRRAAWRLAALHWDEPRSPLKRLRWRWATRDIRRELADAGIAAQFPEAPQFDPGAPLASP